nr:retrotransposon protein, putative, Ty1-copia subclass [Tanacetum cinerariifolium]
MWTECILTATYLINRLPSSVLNGKDVKFFENIFPFKDSEVEKNDITIVLQDVNHINFFDFEYPGIPNDDERVANDINKGKSDSSSSSESGININIADFPVDSGNDADSSNDFVATRNEEVATLEEIFFSEGNLDQNLSSSQGVQNVRSSSRQIVFSKNYNDFVVESKKRLFILNHQKDIFLLIIRGCFLPCYVDDIIITGNNVSEIEKFKVFLKSKFIIKDLGKPKYFLGIEVVDTDKGICLNQRKCVLDLLCEYGMLACRPAKTPLLSKLIISNEANDKDSLLENITDYQKLIRKLIYLINTRPDISYVVHYLSQFMHSPLTSHLKIAFKILRYLKSCPGLEVIGTQLSRLTISSCSYNKLVCLTPKLVLFEHKGILPMSIKAFELPVLDTAHIDCASDLVHSPYIHRQKLSLVTLLRGLRHAMYIHLFPSTVEVIKAHTAWIKGSKEIPGLMLMTMEPEIQRNLENLHAHEMLLELKTLFAQQAEQELLQTTRDFHFCKQEEGQLVSLYVLNIKGYIDNLERLGHPVTLGLGNYNMHIIGKTVNKLHDMLKLHEQTLPKNNAPSLHAIRAGKVQKLNKHKKPQPQMAARGQNHRKRKNKLDYAPKLKIPPPPKREDPAKDSICHECGETGHWKRNCPQYLAELLKKKKNAASGAGGSVSRNNMVYFSAIPRDGTFEINLSNSYTNKSSIYAVSKKRAMLDLDYALLWHCRLGHISKKRIEKLQHDGLFNSSDLRAFEKCVPCMSGKMAIKPYTHQVEIAKDLLGLIHNDVCGLFKIMSRQGANYFVTFTDDFSRYGYVYLLKHKHEVFETFKVFQKEVENQLGKTIKSLRSDRRGEYTSQEFLDHLKDQGIIAHRTPPYTPQYNGVSERRNRTLLDMVRSMMSQTTLPKSFWDYALETTARILNMVPTKKVEKTPYESYNSRSNRSLEDLEIIQEEDTHPSTDTSLNHEEDDQQIDEPQRDLGEPANYKAALLDPESKKWLNAMNVEMQSMKDNKVWVLVEFPPNGKAVGSKWLFKKKTDMDGVVHTYKARLMAKGYTQTSRIDYEETFSLVADIRAIRILIAIAAYYDFKIWQIDVKTISPNGYLNEKQASRQWNKRFDDEIKKFGFTQNRNEPCVYLKASGSNITFLILYVDDILIMGYLRRCFAMKDLGEAAYILGINIYRDRSWRVFCYTDVGYLTDADDLKSRIGYVFVLNGGAVDWKSAKQSIFATSSAEVEYIAAFDASKEAVWVRKFIYGLGVVPTIKEPISMYCDNTRAIAIANESRITKGARHFRTKVYYLHEVIEYDDVKLEKVHTNDNLADPFTKALAFPKHSEHTRNIGIFPASSLM